MAYLAVSDLETHLGRTFAVADSDTAEAAVAAAVALIDATAASPGRLFVGGMLESGLGRTSAVAVAAYLAVRDPSAFPTDLGPSQRYVDEDLTDDVVVDDHGRLVVGGGLGLGAAPHPRRLAAATVELVTVQA